MQQIAESRGYALQDHSLALYGLRGKPDCPGSHKTEAPKAKAYEGPAQPRPMPS